MNDAREPAAENETEVFPALGGAEDIARTRELPAVQEETVVTPPPVKPPVVQDDTVVTPPPVEPPSTLGPAAQQPRPAQAAPRESPVAPPPAGYQSPAPVVRPAPATAPPSAASDRSGRGTGWRTPLLAIVAVLVVAAVAGAVVARERRGTAAPGGSGASAAVAVRATITSFDPSGGSGFRQESGSTWRTQTYQSAGFGNLKDGVGLLLDLGAGRQVTTVTFEVVGGPIAVDLRTGDARAASAGGYRTVASAGSASGLTTLTPKDAGKHRYWLIWVTRLASQDGGYRAVIRDPAVKARRS